MLQGGIVTGTLTFEGGGGNGSAISFHPGGGSMAVLDDSSGGTLSCSDPCIVAFDGGTGSGSAVAYHPGGAPNAAHDDTAADCDHGTGPGPAPVVPPLTTPAPTPAQTAVPTTSRVPAASSPRLLADMLAATTSVPVGTEVAAGRATYTSPGNHTLALPLTAAGRTLLEQVKAADTDYWAANPTGQSPPYAQLTLTLTFTPYAAASTTGFPVAAAVVPLAVIVVVAGGVTGVLVRRRRTRPSAA